MKFRNAILLGSLGMVLTIVVSISFVVATVVDNDARAALDVELSRNALVLEEIIEHRQSLLAANAKVVAQEPRLKAIVATEEIDHATVYDVAWELRRAVGSDLFLLTDGAGRLVADTADASAEGFDLTDKPLVATALTDGESQGMWLAEGRGYQMVARRLAFGDETVGVLIVGWEVDDDLVTVAARQTGSGVVVLADGEAIASSLHTDARRGALPVGGPYFNIPISMAVDDTPHRAIMGPLLGDVRFTYFVLRSLDGAQVTSQRLIRQIYGIGAVALAVAIGLSLWLSYRLTQPLLGLIDLTQRVAQGDVGRWPVSAGLEEIQILEGSMNTMMGKLENARAQQANKERLEGEMEIATRIQTSILPPRLNIPGYTVAATMVTATEVGGDYYDVIATETGGWLGIGDVAGHGVSAGLVMLMVQSATNVLVRGDRSITPSTVVERLNALIFENVRVRLAQDEHVTFTLLRCSQEGDVLFAGAHEDMIVWRKQSGTVEQIETPGAWLGVLERIGNVTRDHTMQLSPGDVLLLYTDGATEVMNEDREQYGIERLCQRFSTLTGESVAAIVDSLRADIGAWNGKPDDDVTLMVVRYDGVPGKA